MTRIGSRSVTIKKLDEAFSKFIRNRDKRCVTCGTSERLTCSHLFTRVAHSTRWSEINCHCQCSGCNMRHKYDAGRFTAWFLHKFGQEMYEILYSQHCKTRKYPTGELLILLEHYTRENRKAS